MLQFERVDDFIKKRLERDETKQQYTVALVNTSHFFLVVEVEIYLLALNYSL